ncbi:PREDICTED: kelch-like protein 21 [Rhagoletis zephyria]|uniref:kelch-like protein 21 n=1 Tax=Rhagoletis zephyria TaxID=28612 RepID=UPI0008112D78|nr:PREDICTED: kelch-like protein 21 [Rhagoletis zephyria]
MADLPEIPPQNATIDAYITEVKDKIAWVEEQQSKGLRTTDYTLTDFSETKRDRMWKMKQTGEMTDTILITSDGQSEFVHMDIMLELGAKEVFFGKEKASNESKFVKEYTVKEDISSAVLSKMVHYAYLEKCQLEEEPASLVIALSKTAFKYGLNSLLKYCIAHMMKNCSPPIAYFAYELTLTYNRSSSKGSSYASSSLLTIDSKAAQTFFQKFIEDHFEEMVGTVIYVFGGSNGREIFRTMCACDVGEPMRARTAGSRNARVGQWERKADMLERRCYVSSTVLDGRVYAIGGFNQQDRVKKCERYDPTTDQWTAIADLNYSRSDATAVSHGGRIYVAGGINDNTIESSVEVYCPVGDRWQLVKAMASPRTSFSLASFDGRIWAMGGNDGEQRGGSCESFDPLTGVWRAEAPLVNGRSTFKAITFMGELYAIGGYNGQSPISTVEKYSPGSGHWRVVRHLRHDRSGMALLVLPNDFLPLKI